MKNYSVPCGLRLFGGVMIICATVLLPGCRKAVTPPPLPVVEKPKPPTAVPMWLGNAERNFYGSGPWKDGDLKIIWEVGTKGISGRLHKDPWVERPGRVSHRFATIAFSFLLRTATSIA